MDENKDRPRKISTCFEGSSCAEMMQKIMDEEGIGSLCEEMMRSVMKGRGETKEEPHEADKNTEAMEEKNHQEFETAQVKNKNQ